MAEASNLDAALELAAAGLAVFPVRITLNRMTQRYDKQPCITGWKTRATTDQAAIHEFWQLFPYAVPGIALGQAGLVVLDADRHGGPDGVGAFRHLADRQGLPMGAVCVQTAGFGEHWIFRNLHDEPLGNCEGALPGGINMRGHGGFIVAPGAIRPDGRRWREPTGATRLCEAYAGGSIPLIPQWIVDRIRAPRGDHAEAQDQAAKTEQPWVTGRERAYAAAALEHESMRVAQAPVGTRNETLNKAAFALGSMAAARWIETDLVRSRLFRAAETCGLVRAEGPGAARATIESGLRGGAAKPRSPLPEGGFGTIGTIGTEDPSAWAEPDLSYLGSGRSDPVPFPADLLGPFWSEWCLAHARARCVPVDYVAAALLASASALIGNARWSQATPEWSEPPVLWIGVVGSPSAGKSPAMDPVLSAVRQVQNDAIEAAKPLLQAYEDALELARAKQADWKEQVREAVKSGREPPPRPVDAIEPDPVHLPRVVVGDTTPEKLGSILQNNPKGLLLYRDEIAGWLGSFGRYSSGGGSERAMWLEAYGGRPYTIDRQKNPEPIVISHLSVAVLGGVQPDKLNLITGGADDGLAVRLLWSWPEPVSGFSLARESVNGRPQEEGLRRLQALSMPQAAEGTRQPGYILPSEAAAAYFERYVADTKARARAASGMFAGSLGKVPGHVMRLALVLEYLAWSEAPFRSEPSRIGETAMLSAIGLVDGYFLPMARRVLGEAAIPDEDRRAMELAQWIAEAKPNQFNARGVRRKVGGVLRESRHMSQACEVLIHAGWIKPVQHQATQRGGRAPSLFEVNPAVLVQSVTA